jgi:GNAT superfamily N-acetyltransferase
VPEAQTIRTRPERGSHRRTVRQKLLEVVKVDVLCWEPVRPLREPRTRVPVELRRMNAATRSEWLSVVSPGRRRGAERFLARGDEGWMALVAGRYAGWMWLSRVSHRDRWSGLRIRLAPGEAYAYALWVEPADRPNGVAAALMTATLGDVRDDPALTRVYGWVDKRNRESQMLVRMLGFKPVQEVKRLHVLSRIGLQVPFTDRPPGGMVSRK